MRARPVRDKIYLPVLWFGVRDSDWKFVIGAGLAAYAVPFLLDLKLLRVPLEIWTTLATLVLAIAFFNFCRIGRRPMWLEHQLRTALRSTVRRRTLPQDPKRPPWLL